MATTITNVNEALLDDLVIPALRNVLPILRAFSLKVIPKGNIVVNNTTRVQLSTDPTGGAKTPGTMVTDTGALTGVDVTLDTPYGAAFSATEGTMPPTSMEQWWATQAAGGVYVCAKAVVDSALALVTQANFAAKVTKPVGDFGQAALAELWEQAETTIKQRERTFGMNAKYAAALMGSGTLALALGQTGSTFIQTGVLPAFLGMSAWSYAGFPSNSENLGGAVFGRAAIAVAVAELPDLMASGDGNIMYRRSITEPDSGITAKFTVTGDGGGTMKGEVALLYGVAKGDGNALVRLVSA